LPFLSLPSPPPLIELVVGSAVRRAVGVKIITSPPEVFGCEAIALVESAPIKEVIYSMLEGA